MSKKSFVFTAMLACSCLVADLAQAHFPWLVSDGEGNASLFFGEGLTDRTYQLPPAIENATVYQVRPGAERQLLPLEQVATDDFVGLRATKLADAGSLLVSQTTYGIHHGSRLDYYTVHHSGKLPTGREAYKDLASDMKLNAQVIDTDQGVDVFVVWDGKPLAGVDVTLYCDEGHEEGSATSDAEGKVAFSDAEVESGLNAIMVGHKLDQSGKFADQAYESQSHYLTMTFFDPDSE